jgi:hypothetical protein
VAPGWQNHEIGLTSTVYIIMSPQAKWSSVMKWSVKASAVAAALVAATAVISVPAQASIAPQIDARKCNPNDPTPQIEFYSSNGALHCFGGTVGSLFPSFNAFTMHSGGYYGNFSVKTATGSHVVWFTPDDVLGFPGGPGIVFAVTITPPF